MLGGIVGLFYDLYTDPWQHACIGFARRGWRCWCICYLIPHFCVMRTPAPPARNRAAATANAAPLTEAHDRPMSKAPPPPPLENGWPAEALATTPSQTPRQRQPRSKVTPIAILRCQATLQSKARPSLNFREKVAGTPKLFSTSSRAPLLDMSRTTQVRWTLRFL